MPDSTDLTDSADATADGDTGAEEVDGDVEPALPKPADLTGNLEEMRYVGWNLPKECNHIEVGSIMAVFCPDLRYLMHT